MPGDRTMKIDLECGWNAGVKKCLLVRTGYGAELERRSPAKLQQAVKVDDLAAAAEWILTRASVESRVAASKVRVTLNLPEVEAP
jgi:hypothetical protein